MTSLIAAWILAPVVPIAAFDIPAELIVAEIESRKEASLSRGRAQ